MATANGQRLISCEIRLPRVGIWSADFEVDTTEGDAVTAFAPGDDGKIRVTLDHAGAQFIGTVTRSGAQGAKLTGRIVGGAGGLASDLPAKNYQSPLGVEVSTVLADILRESGEELSETASQEALARRLPRWTRAAGQASQALTRLVDAAKVSWRVLRDGTVWVGTDAYSTAECDHVVVGADDNQAGVQLVASTDSDEAGPLLLDPGTTFNGRRVEQVIHRLTKQNFRSEIAERTAGQALKAAMGGQSREILYSRSYHAKVSAMNLDGTVQVVPDDVAIAGGGLDNVRIWLGVPGTVTVPDGARCILEFEGGDPAKPYVTSFGGGDLTELKIGTGAQFVARADRVDERIAALEDALNAHITQSNANWLAFATHIHPVAGVLAGGATVPSGPTVTPAPSSSAHTPGSSTAADKVKVD